MEKFLSGKRDQGDRRTWSELGRLAFVANQGVPGTDLVVEKRYSC